MASKERYWAVRPKTDKDNKSTRIEKAETARRACLLAFGREGIRNRGVWAAKDLGTHVAVIRSDSKRIALLQSEEGWIDPYEGEKR